MIKSLSQITQHKALFSYKNICQRSISVFGIMQAPEKSNPDTMEKQTVKHQSNTHDDVTAHSFGEGYATRSDEDGFGGTNALTFNEAAAKIQEDNKTSIHENHPAYDKTQGSEVAEKETSRHQKSPC